MEGGTATQAIVSALTTGLADMGENILGIAVVVVPIALTVWGAMLGIRYAKKFFSAISK